MKKATQTQKGYPFLPSALSRRAARTTQGQLRATPER